jgi:hypothetical protein
LLLHRRGLCLSLRLLLVLLEGVRESPLIDPTLLDETLDAIDFCCVRRLSLF